MFISVIPNTIETKELAIKWYQWNGIKWVVE